MQIDDLLQALRAEFEMIRNDLGAFLPTMTDCDAAVQDTSELYANQLGRGAETASMLELSGLTSVCEHAASRARLLPQLQADSLLGALEWHDQLLELIMEYLAGPGAPGIAERLARHCAEERSGAAMEEQAVTQLQQSLDIAPALPEEMAELIQQEVDIIRPEDTSLDVPDDVDRTVYDAFLADAPDYSRRFSKYISALVTGNLNAEMLKEARRIVHSLKGSANIVGIRGLGKLAHRLEDVLDYLAGLPAIPELPEDLKELLLDASDALDQMIAVLRGEEVPPAGLQELLQRVSDWSFRVQQEDFVLPVATEPAPPVPHEEEIPPQLAISAGAELSNPLGNADPVATQNMDPEEEASLRVPVRVVDQMFRNTEGLVSKLARLHLSLKGAQQRHLSLIRQHQEVQARLREMEELVNKHSSLMESKEAAGLIDPLELHRYSEMHSVCQMLIEASEDHRQMASESGEELLQMDMQLDEHKRMGKDLQYLVAGTRMLPLSTLSARLERNVRQTCRTTGKQAELQITGDDIRVDSDVLSRLAEPLMHVLRNAIDHGIELPNERVALGKNKKGHLSMHFSRHGQTIEVLCSDDGRGYDYARIRDKAIAAGLIDAQAKLSEYELAQLTMRSGFSTSSQVTEVSGRGVGMDIVLTRMQAMHGNVTVSSKQGEGTQICLQFQSSLVTQHVLLARVGEWNFAVSSHMVELALPAHSSSVIEVNGKRYLSHMTHQYEHRYLAELLGMQEAVAGDPNDKPLLLVRHAGGSVALTVDELVDTQQSIVKNMGKYLANVHGALGAVVRADGSVAPLLDIAALWNKPADQALVVSQDMNMPARRSIMVVDDSSTMRQSLSMLLEDAGYRVTVARDGMQAITMLDAAKPDMVLTDLEMPVLNGLELTQHLRTRSDMAGLPIIMITSRSMDKHRKMAEQVGVSRYLTKPYTDEELLDAIDELMVRPAAAESTQAEEADAQTADSAMQKSAGQPADRETLAML